MSMLTLWKRDQAVRWARALLNRVRSGDKSPTLEQINKALTILGDLT